MIIDRIKFVASENIGYTRVIVYDPVTGFMDQIDVEHEGRSQHVIDELVAYSIDWLSEYLERKVISFLEFDQSPILVGRDSLQ